MVYHLALDLETTSLYADEGIIICYALVGQDNTLSANIIENSEQEKMLLATLIKELWVTNLRHPTLRLLTYNGSNFDFPMLITRLLNLKMLDELAKFKKNFNSKLKHLDLYLVTKSNILLKSRKLRDLCKYFGISYSFPEETNPIELWQKKDFQTLKNYCINHAKVLHEIRKKFIEHRILERD
jgi:DNA polymerase elongation subunit (family B)